MRLSLKRCDAPLCSRTEEQEDLLNLFQVKQRDADKVDLWLATPAPLPLTVLNASLSHKLQGVMKVQTHVIPAIRLRGYIYIYICVCVYLPSGPACSLPVSLCTHCTCLCCPLPPAAGLQRPADSGSRLLAHPVPPAAQQGRARQPAVHPEPADQPGYGAAHPPLLPLHSFQGNRAAGLGGGRRA